MPSTTNRRRRWYVVALLDFDSFDAYRAFPERARFFAKTFRIRLRYCRVYRRRTRRGWHIILSYYSYRPPSPLFMVATQAILGSDSRRETFNLFRAVRLRNAPLPWQKVGRWNTLYRRKLQPEVSQTDRPTDRQEKR